MTQLLWSASLPSPHLLFNASWAVWAASWIIAAFWAERTVLRQTSRLLLATYALIVASVIAPVAWRATGLPCPRVWDVGAVGGTGLALAAIPGFLFAWWARLHLGAFWSAAVVVKVKHRVVRTGPYALVRHPIYTGILWAALVTDIAAANAPAALSLACLYAGFRLKAGVEERFLAASLPEADYAAYRRCVPMLVPLGRPST